jgi:hypothetical protein
MPGLGLTGTEASGLEGRRGLAAHFIAADQTVPAGIGCVEKALE